MATVAAVIASTHHPFYLPGQHVHRRRPTTVRRRVGRQDRDLPRDADPGRARRARDGRQRPLPPAVAGQHAAVPGRQGAVLRRQLVQRGARVRPAADDPARARRSCPPTSCATASTLDFDLAFSNELRIDHSITCPIITLRPAGRPADRADLHQHLRAAAAAAEAVRPAGQGDPRAGRVVARATSGSRSSAPATSRSSSAGRASSASTAPTRSSTARPSTGSPAATSRAASAR